MYIKQKWTLKTACSGALMRKKFVGPVPPCISRFSEPLIFISYCPDIIYTHDFLIMNLSRTNVDIWNEKIGKIWAISDFLKTSIFGIFEKTSKNRGSAHQAPEIA